jgi:hypothetical protein
MPLPAFLGSKLKPKVRRESARFVESQRARARNKARNAHVFNAAVIRNSPHGQTALFDCAFERLAQWVIVSRVTHSVNCLSVALNCQVLINGRTDEQPAATHASISVRRQRMRPPSRNGAGQRPESQSRYRLRTEMLRVFATILALKSARSASAAVAPLIRHLLE